MYQVQGQALLQVISFIFHNNLMSRILVSLPLTKITRLKEALGLLRSHSQQVVQLGPEPSSLATLSCLPGSLPRWGMGPHPKILSLEGL